MNRTFASLRKHRNYRLFFMGQLVSLSGTWMQTVALAWFVVELTSSPIAVGILAFCRFVPFTIFGLVAGVYADRFDNRRLVMSTQVSAMAVSVALAVLALSGGAELWLVYLLAALGGTATVFDAPGRHALTFQMVGRDELPNAVALNATLFNASRIVGPAIAGVIIATGGTGVCFVVNSVSFLAVLTALVLMRPDELYPLDRGDSRPTVLRGVRDGLVYAWRTPEVRLILAITTVLSTLGFNLNVLVPVLAEETLDAGPEVFGALTASFGAGALAGALLTATLSRASFKLVLAGSGGFGLATLALAPQAEVVVAAMLLFAAGVFFILWNSNSQTILQLTAPDHLRGRVLSLFLFAFAGLAPLGALVAGWLAHVGGTQLAFAVAGGAGIAMAALGWAKNPFRELPAVAPSARLEPDFVQRPE
ncbi:MAG: MFS transporter [Gaiellaceae bacterium]